jgi:hypothetical protein
MSDAVEDFKSLSRVEEAYDKYRSSGLGLMATISALSLGAFVGLFNRDETKGLAFPYVLPVVLAILQQLTHYFGSKHAARSRHAWYVAVNFSDKSKVRDGDVFNRYANLYYGFSDHLCWLSCLALCLVSIWPLKVLGASLALWGFLLVLVALLIFFSCRAGKVCAEVKRDWPS